MINTLRNYFQKIGAKRIIVMIIGNIFLCMGISIFKLSSLGNDPFSGMIMGSSDAIKIPYSQLLIMVNVFLFIIEFFAGRNLIGIGTLVNALLMGYIVTFFNGIWQFFSLTPQLFWQKVIVVCVGVIVCGFGISLYQSSDVGVAPYDSLSIIMVRKQSKVPYFWCRMATDAFCALICFLSGGIIGLGTLVSGFGFGPIINFFNVRAADKILGKNTSH